MKDLHQVSWGSSSLLEQSVETLLITELNQTVVESSWRHRNSFQWNDVSQFVCTGRARDNVTTPTSRGRTRWVHAGCDFRLSEGIKMKLSSKGTESFRDKSFQIKRNNMQFMCCLNRSQAVSPLYFMSFILSWTNCTPFTWNTPGPERICSSCMCGCVCSGLEKLAAACLKPQTPWMKNIWRHDGAVMSLLPPQREISFQHVLHRCSTGEKIQTVQVM